MSMSILNSFGEIPFNNKMFNFYIDQEFVDTELVLANGKIKTHSLILAAHSKKLYNMLTSQVGEQKRIMLTQYSKETIRIILEFMYRGIVTYPSFNDEDVETALTFLGLCFKTDESAIKVEKDEIIVEISDSETETNCTDIANKYKTHSEIAIIEQERQNEHFSPAPSNVFNKSYYFLTECDNNLEIEFAETTQISEKSPSNLNDKLGPKKKQRFQLENKRRKLNPFRSDLIDTSQSMIKNQLCSSKTASKNDTNKKGETNLSVHEKRESKKSKETPTIKQRKIHESKNVNIWINKKQTYFSKKYCLLCETQRIHIKQHIKSFHQKVIRFTSNFCEKCSRNFFFKEFYKYHKQICE